MDKNSVLGEIKFKNIFYIIYSLPFGQVEANIF